VRGRGAEADKGRRRGRSEQVRWGEGGRRGAKADEGGGLERRRRLRDFSLPRSFVDQMKGPVYFASQPGLLQVGMENEGWAFKFF
jgi:hypothetical protein